MLKCLLVGACFLALFSPTYAQTSIQLPDLFSEHMVLQREAPIPVWGRAKANAIIKVSLGKGRVVLTANSLGEWQGTLPAMPSGGPYALTIRSNGETICIRDVYIGEVWLCSGQSNMEWPLKQSAEAEEEIPAANLPLVRLFQLKKKHDTYKTPYSEAELAAFNEGHFFHPSKWDVCTPESAAEFSGVAYHFGRQLYDSLQVPIGLIQAAVGGSPAQSWISKQALASHPQMAHLVAKDKRWTDSPIIHPWLAVRAHENWANWEEIEESELPGHPFAPGYLFNAAMSPLAPYGIKGAIWYQGESNATHPGSYAAMMDLLIDNWRASFQQEGFPFYFVQLPRIKNRSRWPDFREAQQRLLQKANTGMIVMIDEGHPTDVHPREKKVVGHRLARLALANTYHYDLETENSLLATYAWNHDDRTITLQFSNAYEGLSTTNAEPLRGIQIQGYLNGEQEIFIAPETVIIKDSTIKLTYPKGFLPTTVKYAWAPFPDHNLVNGAELPVGPFRVELRGSN